MTSFKDFNKDAKSNKYANWETQEGNYGCMSCEENVEFAYVSIERGLILWVCPAGHESKVKFQ